MKRYYKLPSWKDNETTYSEFRGDLSQVRKYGHGFELKPCIDYDEHTLYFALYQDGKICQTLAHNVEDNARSIFFRAAESNTLNHAHTLWKKNKLFQSLFKTIELLWPSDNPPADFPFPASAWLEVENYIIKTKIDTDMHTEYADAFALDPSVTSFKLIVPPYLGDIKPVIWKLKGA